jgi:hypothetical protein
MSSSARGWRFPGGRCFGQPDSAQMARTGKQSPSVRPRFSMGALRGPKEFPTCARFFAPLPLHVTREQVERINLLRVGLRFWFRRSLWGWDLASVREYRPPDVGLATIPTDRHLRALGTVTKRFYTVAGNACRERLQRV